MNQATLILIVLALGLLIYAWSRGDGSHREGIVRGWSTLRRTLPLLVVAYLLRHRIGFRAKALSLTAVVFLIGFAGLHQWGLVGMGIPSLFFAVLFTSNVLRTHQTYAVLGLAVLAILAVGHGAVLGGLHDDIDVRGYVTSWMGWLLMKESRTDAVTISTLG